MKLIDTHAHLYYESFDHDRLEMMERTWDSCEAVICIGAGEKSSRQSVAASQDDDKIFAAVGIHPHEVADDPSFLEELAKSPKVVAIGECGLDYKLDPVHPHSEVDTLKQHESLIAHINLANKLGLPVVIHVRDAWEDLIPILKNNPPQRGVIHSFTGGLKEAQDIIDLGLYISFSGMLTYPANEHIRAVAAMAPLNKIVLETDAPYLPPQPVRGQRNEPSFVKMVAERLAEIRGASLDEVTEATSSNARTLFSLPTVNS